MSNTVRDKECDYGTYANEKRLSDAGIRCTRPGTESVDLNGIAIAVCKERFEKINSIFGNAFAQKGDSEIQRARRWR